MKDRVIVFFQISLLLLLICVPAASMAGSTPQISLSLNKPAASVGESVAASGTTAQGAWVPLKVIDGARNILVFDARKADASGYYSIDFIVPAGAYGELTVVVGEGGDVAIGTLTVETGLPVDTEAPTWPAESTLNATNVNRTGLTLTWSAATDNVGVTGYNVYQGITRLNTSPVTGNSYNVTGLSAATTYTFKVEAGDEAGNWSTNGPSTTVTTKTRGGGGDGGDGGDGDGSSQPTPELIQVPDEPDAFSPLEGPADLKGHWARDSIMSLLEQGIITGYPDGSFKPDNTITRAEFATILVKAFKLENSGGTIFADTAAHWAKDYIAAAAANGVVNGYDTDTFGPDNPITREQMAVMIVKAARLTPATGELSFTDSGSISAWAREAVVTATANGIMKGYPDNTFLPQGSATRAEAVTVVMNALNTLGQ